MRSLRHLKSLSLVLLAISGTALAADTPEVEPNNTKDTAQLVDFGGVGMDNGDTITGGSTGGSTVAAGANSADYYRVRTKALPAGIYKHQLVLSGFNSTQVGLFTNTIRGLTQTAGVPNPGTDSTIQTGITSLSGSPAGTKGVQFYTFGPSADIVVRVTGTSTTTNNYTLTLLTTPVTANVMSGTALEGPVSVAKDPTTTTDTDFWVYNASTGLAVPTFGNDDPGSVTRTQGPGNYVVAISNFNLANDQGSPSDDTFRTGNVLDFPGVVVNSSGSTVQNCNIRITSGSGQINPVIAPPPAPQTQFKLNQFDVVFYNYSVISSTLPTNPTCNASVSPSSVRNDGVNNTATFTVNVTPGMNPSTDPHTVSANLISVGGPLNAIFTEGPANTFTYVHTVPFGTAANVYSIDITVSEQSFPNRSSTCTTTLSVTNPPTGTCCLPGDQVCQQLTQADCAAAGGVYGGDNTSCSACTCAIVPANDFIENAEPIALNSSLTGYTCQATTDAGLPSCITSVTTKGVWYKVIGSGTNLTAETCGVSTSFDTKISVFCGSPNSLTCIIANDDACGAASRVNWCSQAGADYYILVHGFGVANGRFTLSLIDQGTSCESTIQCLPTGACCLPSEQSCVATTQLDCESRGGNYLGNGTACDTLSASYEFSSSDAFPIAISDNSTITSTIVIGPGFGTVSALRPSMTLSHSFCGDLVGTLSNGTITVSLFNRTNSLNDLTGEYEFSDAAATAFAGSNPTTPGVYRPAGLLSDFDGQPYEGTWTLTIIDQADGDVGELTSFNFGRVITATPNCSFCPTCAADYDNDGGVTGSDVEAFFVDFEAGAACADVDGDGGITGSDVEAFFVVFEAGGC